MSIQQRIKKRPHIDWKEHIVLWEQSGLSPVKYCQKQDLGYSAFLKQRKKYFDQKNKPSAPHFIQIKPIANQGSEKIVLQLVLPNGVRVGVPPNLNLTWLEKVLSVAGSLSCCV